MQDFQQRKLRLRHALAEANQDALIVCTRNSLGYLTGAFEDPHERFFALVLMADGREAVVCPALSVNQLERHGLTNLKSWTDNEDPLQLFSQVIDEFDLRVAVIAVDSTMRADHLLQIQDLLPAARFVSAGPIIAEARKVKDSGEIANLKRAAKFVDEVAVEIVGHIAPGMTERQVEGKIRTLLLDKGTKPTFAIVAVGPNSAEPHHLSDETPIQPGNVVLMDFGCEHEGYQADITRVVHVGAAPEEVKQVYRTVANAYEAGLQAVRVGATGAEVDRASRSVIEQAGYGEQFIHRTGHGIGLDGHEDPNMAANNLLPIQKGNTFSIEPGIYLAGQFGVRLENIAACDLASGDGVSLNQPFPAEILEL